MITYPWQRNILIDYVDEIADKDRHQQNVAQDRYKYNLEYVIHFLYDDTGFNDDTEGMIGYSLLNQEEAELVRNLINALDIVWDKYGMYKTDEEFINYPEWPQVIEAAGKLVTLIKENDKTSFWKRENLVFYLEIFAGQREHSMERRSPLDMSFELFSGLRFLYEDTSLANDAEANISDILLNRDEVSHVKNLVAALDIVRDKYGKDNADEIYFNSSEWPDVIDAASKLLTLIKANDSARNS